MSVLSNRHRHTRVFVHEESYTHTHSSVHPGSLATGSFFNSRFSCFALPALKVSFVASFTHRSFVPACLLCVSV